MAWTQEQYDKLVENISQGVEEVWYSDKKVKYMKLSDMLQLKNIMERELGLVGNGKVEVTFNKGINPYPVGFSSPDNW